MAQDSISIGPVPYEEACQQLGTKQYDAVKARLEAEVFKAQLLRMYPAPLGAKLRVKSNPHDFGNYYEVEAVFNDTMDAAVDWAYKLESEGPANWDAEAKAALGL